MLDTGSELSGPPSASQARHRGGTLSSDSFCSDWPSPSFLSERGWTAGQMPLKVPQREIMGLIVCPCPQHSLSLHDKDAEQKE